MVRKALGVIILTMTSCTVMAKIAVAQNFQGGISFVIGNPRGDFEQHVDRNGYGVSIEGLYKKKTSPLGIGLEFMYMNYGNDERTERLSTTIPDLKVRVENSNNIVGGNIVLRLMPYQGLISPYIDGLFGFKYLYTRTTIKNEGILENKEIASSTNYEDMTMGYGIGGGVMLCIYTQKEESEMPFSIYVDVKGRYIYGGEAEYLKEGSIERVDGDVVYHNEKSETDMMQYHIGLTVAF